MTQISKDFTLHIQDLRRECSVHALQVRWHFKIKDVKDLLHSTISIPPSRLQLFQTNCPIPLSTNLTLHCLNIDRSGCTLHLSIIEEDVIGAAGFVLNHAQEISLDRECANILDDIRSGLSRETMPIKTDVLDCTGGVYFMRGICGRRVAVFKPFDEEQGMPNNTKGFQGTGELGLRQYAKPGYGCVREVAAYIMDVDNFCRVPPTLLVHCEHPVLNYPERSGCKSHPYPKLGSLQKFVYALGTFEDVGSSLLGVLEVQKVALLDLRLLNGDRNASNILAIRKQNDTHTDCTYSNSCIAASGSQMSGECTKFDSAERGVYELVPIDHGYCLPSRLLIHELDWAWFYYPQIDQPVHDEIKQYLKGLDLDVLLRGMLSQVSLSEESLFLARVSHQLVVEGVAAGLTLFNIAAIVARTADDIPSALEKALDEAEENAFRTIEVRVTALSRSPRSASSHFSHSPPISRKSRTIYLPPEEGFSYCIPRVSGLESERIMKIDGYLPFSRLGSSLAVSTNTCAESSDAKNKSVRFNFTGSCSMIEDSIGCTDSSGTNTPSVKGSSGPSSPDRDHVTPEDTPIATTAATMCVEIEDSAVDIYDVIRISRRESRIPFVDADEALECRIGSPLALQKCPAATASFCSIDTGEESFASPFPTQPSCRMKRVNTLNQVALPTLERCTFFHDFGLHDPKHFTLAGTSSCGAVDPIDAVGLYHIPTPLRQGKSFVVPGSASKPPNLATCSVDSEHPSRWASNSGTITSYCDDEDAYITDIDASPLSSPTSPGRKSNLTSFLRVTSFSAFSSAPIYDGEGAERRLGNLRKERRRQIALTDEFSRIRLSFAKNSVGTLISKAVRAKAVSQQYTHT